MVIWKNKSMKNNIRLNYKLYYLFTYNYYFYFVKHRYNEVWDKQSNFTHFLKYIGEINRTNFKNL